LRAHDRRQLAEVIDLVGEVLVDDVVAVCIHGSTAADRLGPASDLDVLGVTVEGHPRRPAAG
jgi:predicted nucleotidyltransferase